MSIQNAIDLADAPALRAENERLQAYADERSAELMLRDGELAATEELLAATRREVTSLRDRVARLEADWAGAIDRAHRAENALDTVRASHNQLRAVLWSQDDRDDDV